MDTKATPVADRLNTAYAGSIVTRGRAKGLVVATGMATSVGQLALDVLGEGGGKSLLLVRMERFTRVVAVSVLVAAAAIGVPGVTIGGYPLSRMFMFAIALVVSAIPEGLPVAMTVVLAIATTRIARRGLIVRRLTAVEPLDLLARAGVHCNESDPYHRNGVWVWHGDAVDVAILSFGHKLGRIREATLDLHVQVNQIPIEPEHQFAASFHKADGVSMVCVKGAPERILAMCNESICSEFDKSQLESIATSMAEQGYRILALANGTLPTAITAEDVPPAPAGLRFLGFVGMIDPLRPGAKDVVRDCNKAGISVLMVTGDHRVTAIAIARDLALAHDESQVNDR